MVIARLFTGGALSSLLIMGLILIPFPTGWEVGAAIVALKPIDYPNTLFTGDCKARSTETGEIVINLLTECSLGGNSWNIDVDAKETARPSLTITTQQPRHTDAGGEPTPHSQAADTRTVTRQRDTWNLDRHIFMFEFQVNTVADVAKKSCFFVLFGGEACNFNHETSAFVPTYVIDPTGRTRTSNNGLPFDGSSLILFSINPWQGVRTTPENTIMFDQWVGIMQATVFRVENGKVPNAPGSQDFPWAVEKLLPVGGQPNMFSIQGEGLEQTQFGTASLDNRIPRQVIVELPYRLTAGAAKESFFGGGFKGIAPINVFAKYVVRMDVLVVTGYTPQLDYIDSNNNRIKDPGEFTYIDKNNDNLWTVGIDEAVEGTPPSPPPPGITIVDTKSSTVKEADGTATTTTVVKYSDGTSTTTINREIAPPPPSDLQTGCPPNCPPTIQPPPDIFFPSCNFFDLECRLANWQKFPFDLGTTFALALPFIAIAVIVLVAIVLIGARRRGR